MGLNLKPKPCPFCGSDKAIVLTHEFYGYDVGFGVQCDNCKAQIRQFFGKRKEAVKA